MFYVLIVVIAIPAFIVYSLVSDSTPKKIRARVAAELYRPTFEAEGLTLPEKPRHLAQANSGQETEAAELLRKLKADRTLQRQFEEEVDPHLHPRRKGLGWATLIGTIVLMGTILAIATLGISEEEFASALGGAVAIYSEYFVVIGITVSFLTASGVIKLADQRHFKRSKDS